MNQTRRARFSLRTLFFLAAFVAVFFAGRKSHDTLPDISRLFRKTPPTVPVFVTINDIPVGENIHPSDLRVERWPRSQVPQNVIRKPVSSVGMKTRVAIYKGEPISQRHVSSTGR